jgi:hypothetical protein
MKTGVLLGAVMVGLLWLLAGTRVDSIEQKLSAATMDALLSPQHDGLFDKVKVTFSGQSATLSGTVGSDADRVAAARLVSEGVRAGFGLNPVRQVDNQVQVDPAQKTLKPRPWLLAVAIEGKVTIAGVLPSEADKVTAAQALASKLAPQGTLLDNQLQAPPNAQPATDLAATLRALPDLAGVAEDDSSHYAIAVSTCDGQWTQLAADRSIAAIASALAAARPLANDIARATAALETWRAAELEKVRIARLASPSVGLLLLGKELRVIGSVGDEDSKRRLLIGLSTAYGDRKLSDQLQVAASVQPGGDWQEALGSVPKSTTAPALIVLAPGANPLAWDGKGSIDDLKKLLATGTSSLSAQAIWDAFQAARQAPATDSPQK